jgi:uncharacterized protein
MISKLLPRGINFFDLFERQVGFAVEAARFFEQIVSRGHIDGNTLSRIQEIEHSGDEAAHAIIDQLNKTFITPFDREDIYNLTKQLDDVIDMINTIISRMKIYHITEVNMNLVEFAKVIEESVNAVARAIGGMRNRKDAKLVTAACIEIHRLENLGDTMRDRVLEDLFSKTTDPILVMKWKDIFQDAETVLDVCEDVAHVVDSILVKQA